MAKKLSCMVIPSNPADQKVIFAAVKEAEDSMIRIESEKEQIKSIIEDIDEKYPDLGKKFIRKLISTYHKQNIDVLEAETDDFVKLYESIIK